MEMVGKSADYDAIRVGRIDPSPKTPNEWPPLRITPDALHVVRVPKLESKPNTGK